MDYSLTCLPIVLAMAVQASRLQVGQFDATNQAVRHLLVNCFGTSVIFLHIPVYVDLVHRNEFHHKSQF